MTKAVVFGITGYAGSHIADELLARGYTVTGVSRNVSRTAPKDNLDLAAGSVHDTEFLYAVTAGASVIVIALPARETDGNALAAAIPAVLKAAESADARVGVVGGAGSLHVAPGGPRLIDTPVFPDEFKPEGHAHSDVLDALRNADTTVDWFYLSPGATFGAWNPGEKLGTYRVSDDILLADDNQNSTISGHDYATAFVDEVITPAHSRKRFHVAY